MDLGKAANGGTIERINAVLSRNLVPDADGEDIPGAAGFELSGYGDATYPDAPYVTVFGEPLDVMTSNLGQTDNGFANIGSGGANVLSQGFTTGSRRGRLRPPGHRRRTHARRSSSP